MTERIDKLAVRRRSSKNEISLLSALKDLCGEREIAPDVLYKAIEEALIFAYKKTKGADRNVVVDLDKEHGTFKMFELMPVVEEVTDGDREISLSDAQKINPNYEVGDNVRREVSPADFGRIAAQAAKQTVVQKIREAERGVIYDEFNERANDLISGTVERVEDGNVIVIIDKTEAILVPSEQIRGETFKPGDRIKAYIAEVRKIGKGPQIFLSRTHPGFLKRLLEIQVPEIQEGIISVKSIAREAGARSKIAVVSNDENVEPVGTCIGPHGIRIQNILEEIGTEKIDVVQWSEEPAIFIAAALSPAKVIKVAVNLNEKTSRVIVPDNQLSLAIGKEGQNARLAARLTGWKIDIKSKTQAAESELPENMTEVNVGKKPPKQKKKDKKPKNNAPQVETKPVEAAKPAKPDKPAKPKKVEKPAEPVKPVAPVEDFSFDAFDDELLPTDNSAPAVEDADNKQEETSIDFFDDFSED